MRQQDELLRSARRQIQNNRQRLAHYQKLMAMADPVHILRRGFSVTRNANGAVVKSVSEIKAQQKLFTALADGTIQSRVEEITKEEKRDGS